MRTSPHAVSTEICGVVPKVGGVAEVVGIEGGVVSMIRGARKRIPPATRRRALELLAGLAVTSDARKRNVTVEYHRSPPAPAD
jgi:hypothetical protein